MSLKTAIMGGSFDPPHWGHLLIAETVADAVGLDRVVFMPAARSPHKVGQVVTPADQRLALVKAAIDGNSRFEVSNFEVNAGGLSYTAQTVAWALEQSPYKDDDLYWIIGADSLVELPSWRDPGFILEHVSILVAARPGFDLSAIDKTLLSRVTLVETPRIEVSASVVRERVRQGQSIRYWTPDPVAERIQAWGLYTP